MHDYRMWLDEQGMVVVRLKPSLFPRRHTHPLSLSLTLSLTHIRCPVSAHPVCHLSFSTLLSLRSLLELGAGTRDMNVRDMHHYSWLKDVADEILRRASMLVQQQDRHNGHSSRLLATWRN